MLKNYNIAVLCSHPRRARYGHRTENSGTYMFVDKHEWVLFETYFDYIWEFVSFKNTEQIILLQ